MSMGPVPRLPQAEGPVLFVPQVEVPELSDLEVVADVWSAQARQRRAAERRRRSGWAGVDARALTDVVPAGVREDFVAELAVTRDCTEGEAHALVGEALLLTGPLVPVWSALCAGVIGQRHVAAAVDLLGDATAEVTDAVQARVPAGTVAGTTAAVFRERLRHHLYRVDAEDRERRRREALRKVGVWVRRVDEGVSEFVLQGPDAGGARRL